VAPADRPLGLRRGGAGQHHRHGRAGRTPDTKHRGDDCPKIFFLDCGEVSTPILSPDGSLLAFEGIAMNYFPSTNKYIQLVVSDVVH
jgi:hypothetical protein